ncbi:hypothetical protein L6452_21157 [Arctium lappa]|uniref:Uncharacterized protein n=1 Tax=Arctium lappa TaxID=4217 RepID=A0ACB9BCY7_ARCLA|nr:hypothetical protein L6452_21157 [Arctium lappa]
MKGFCNCHAAICHCRNVILIMLLVIIIGVTDRGLKEVNEKFLEGGLGRVKANLTSSVKEGKLSQEKFEKTLSRLKGVLEYESFRDMDMVIEAVIENVPLKQQIFSDLEKYCSPHCILASNTSTIDLNLIGEKTKSHDRIIGEHFFSLAHIMPLLEIGRTAKTSPQVVVDLLDVGKKIRKTPVVVGNCTGFVVNRILCDLVGFGVAIAIGSKNARIMDGKNITLINDLDIQKDDFTVKVRIIRLWNLPMFKNPEQIFSIEMILMDEEGTKIHANVLQKWVSKFKILLHERAAIFIKNPTIDEHVSKYKLIDNTNKLSLYYKTSVTNCLDFNGSLFGFSFVKYQNVISKMIPEHAAVDEGLVVVVIQFAVVKIYRDFLDNSSKANIAEISEVVEGRKVRPTYIITDKNDGSGQVEETEKFECDSDKCKGQDTEEHGDLEMFPEDLNVLLDRKFAIKIEVNNYNIKNSCFVYGISKLTDDENILNELEMRFSAQRPAESDSVNVLSPDFGSVEKLKDVVSFRGENTTPSNVDKSTTDSPVSQEKAYQKKICKSVDLKRDFDEIYDADDAMKGSATKSSKTCIPIEKE